MPRTGASKHSSANTIILSCSGRTAARDTNQASDSERLRIGFKIRLCLEEVSSISIHFALMTPLSSIFVCKCALWDHKDKRQCLLESVRAPGFVFPEFHRACKWDSNLSAKETAIRWLFFVARRLSAKDEYSARTALLGSNFSAWVTNTSDLENGWGSRILFVFLLLNKMWNSCQILKVSGVSKLVKCERVVFSCFDWIFFDCLLKILWKFGSFLQCLSLSPLKMPIRTYWQIRKEMHNGWRHERQLVLCSLSPAFERNPQNAAAKESNQIRLWRALSMSRQFLKWDLPRRMSQHSENIAVAHVPIHACQYVGRFHCILIEPCF